MKQIVRRVLAHTTRSFQCEICGTKYRTTKQAKKCESRRLEIKEFNRGDLVKNREQRICNVVDKQYHFIGTIIGVLGPNLPDYEYESKWLGGKTDRLNGHVYQYEVLYVCPECNDSKTTLYYGPELKSVKLVEIHIKHKNR